MSREDRLFFLCLAVVGLAIPATVVLRHFVGLDPLSWLPPLPGRTLVGVVLTALAVAVCLLNGYLSFLRPWSYRRRHGSLQGYAFTSGMPVVGNVLVGAAGALMPESSVLGLLFLALYSLDTGGIPWFFLSILRHGA